VTSTIIQILVHPQTLLFVDSFCELLSSKIAERALTTAQFSCCKIAGLTTCRSHNESQRDGGSSQAYELSETFGAL